MGCVRQITFSGPDLSGPSRTAARRRLTLLLLIVLACLRALVPVGFEPAADGSFSLTICSHGLPPPVLPEQKGMHGMGMPMPQPHHHEGHGDADGDSYCTFTLGFSAAPPPLLVVALGLLIACLGVVFTRVSAPAGIRLVHIPQARAPPAPL